MAERVIDLNGDIGEFTHVDEGSERAFIACLTSVNIACGGHAGDRDSMQRAVRTALEHGCRIGAHPSLPDREGFGRVMPTSPLGKDDAEKLRASLVAQLDAMSTVVREASAQIAHIKPHGALYHLVATDRVYSDLLAGIAELPLAVMAGSNAISWLRDDGRDVICEAFADRVYGPSGKLLSRREGGLITEPKQAADQALQLVLDRTATACDGSTVHIECETICLHGDTPRAVELAERVRESLENAGVAVQRIIR